MPIREACHVAVQRNHPSKHKLWKHAQARQQAKGQGSIPVLQIVCHYLTDKCDSSIFNIFYMVRISSDWCVKFPTKISSPLLLDSFFYLGKFWKDATTTATRLISAQCIHLQPQCNSQTPQPPTYTTILQRNLNLTTDIALCNPLRPPFIIGRPEKEFW